MLRFGSADRNEIDDIDEVEKISLREKIKLQYFLNASPEFNRKDKRHRKSFISLI